MRTRRMLAVALAVIVALGLAAWGAHLFRTRAQGSPQAVEVQQAVLPPAVDGAAVVGIGEATHGTREFYTAKRVLTEKLIDEHGFRAVAIEGDFGGGRVADDYVRRGVGTPEQAAAAFGFAVYRNQDMADLLRMLREHNTGLPADQQVAVYGIDMQGVDLNKQQLEAYLRPVDPALADQVAQATAELSDDVSPLPQESAAQALPELEDAFTAFTGRQQQLVAATDPETYQLAEQNLRVLVQNLESSAVSAQQGRQVRDEQMATNTTWVVDRQPSRGGVVLLAHNGHVSRVPTGAGPVWTGVLLAEQYGERYVAVGSDLRGGTFGAGRDGQGSVSARQPYRGIFDGTTIGYVTIAGVSPQNRALLHEGTGMVSVGAAWSSWMRPIPITWTFRVAPADAYDALVYVQQSTPTEVQDW